MTGPASAYYSYVVQQSSPPNGGPIDKCRIASITCFSAMMCVGTNYIQLTSALGNGGSIPEWDGTFSFLLPGTLFRQPYSRLTVVVYRKGTNSQYEFLAGIGVSLTEPVAKREQGKCRNTNMFRSPAWKSQGHSNYSHQ